eukprot:CAMPEP_0196761794 /NCGR_PEP_ID=MMETSP1095-20130614/1089_1 /TAXON_ID=96789 ORGANISM="Chromulina nebulosa, Strain UTEXLB2642" /NCGR_SAMPLE_ID=MMETSP1095 /ASSEMBLY_ACC=CAM_ASM_000446 /LENGTH=249 /DNA_ID=CAMNT_0042111753 /DNA_START=26 /DNA_END=771 /DNA_ORIENTATION=-
MLTVSAFNNIITKSNFWRNHKLRAISTKVIGEVSTTSYRLLFTNDDKTISPWHDIPLIDKSTGLYNFITEIPKYTKAKLEVSTKEESNPIAQDIKKGKLRDYHGPIFWNYGCLPQTWEDPNVVHPELKVNGDNDPVDVVEIGAKALPSGSVSQIKVLGVLAMIDDGELDWKVIAINSEDPLASQLNDISDVETKLPGVVSGIREWFRWYKTPDDKPLNAFGFNEVALPKAKAIEVINETHEYWLNLKSG